MTRRKIVVLLCTLVSVFCLHGQSFGQTSFPTGSAIIDMGSASPTVANSLKPYGLVYALLKNNNVPVSVVINSAKVKDGIDFVYNGKSYKGGTFVISADNISSAVSAVLNSWANQGVVIDYTTDGAGTLSVNVTYKINFVPKWAMDKTNGNIAVGFLTAAGIPASAYAFKDPSELSSCEDLFVLPHADPTWATHSNLFDWNLGSKGAIWVGCHAVSVLESLVDPNDGTRKMNFLSSGGLVAFTDHNPTSTPFTNLLPGDPIAQYINKTDGAQLAGSETVYLPKPGSVWNAGAKLITTSTGQVDVPSLSPGAAVENIYGRAFDNPARGLVAYQAAHNIGGTGSDQIAAQRVFFNFSLYAFNDKIPPIINASLSGSSTMTSGVASAFSVSNLGTGSVSSYQWSVSPSTAGTFSAATSATTNFTPASVTSATPIIITCVINGACSRVSFDSKKFTILPSPPTPNLPVVDYLSVAIADGCASSSVTFNVFTNNPDAGNMYGTRTLLSVTGLTNGTVITNTSGDITYTPNPDVKGTITGHYQITNGIITSNVAYGAISITIGDATKTPVITNDAITTLVDNTTSSIAVLANDVVCAACTVTGSLTIRDIPTKPAHGYVYINTNGTLSYLSTKDYGGGTDVFTYQACNSAGYCAIGTVNVTLTADGCPSGQYQLTTTLSTGSGTFSPTIDSYIQSNQATTNFGNAQNFLINGVTSQTKKGLIRFDVLSSPSAVPSNATITSAVTSLTLSGSGTTSATQNPFPITIYNLIKPWTELGVTYTTYDGTNNWGGSGASTASTDYTDLGAGSNPTIALAVGTALTDGLGVQTSDMTSLVQSWVTTPTTNYGILLAPALSTVTLNAGFYSRQAASSSKYPLLTVNYTTPPACLLISASTYNPIAYPDTASTPSNAAVTINVKANDLNYYGNTNTVSAVGAPAHGTTSINGSNNVVYTPDGTFVGVDAFTYTLSDPAKGTTFTGNVRVNVTRVGPRIIADVPPTMLSNVATISSTTTFDVGTNDSDPQTGAPTIGAPTIISGPSNGIATVLTGTNIQYTPSVGFVGTDVFTYRRIEPAYDACSVALSGTATVTITVTNRVPVAGNKQISTFSCVTNTITVSGIASDPEGGTLSPTISVAPLHGTANVNANGTITYTPNSTTPAYAGDDQLTYTVTDPLGATSTGGIIAFSVSGTNSTNLPPVAVNDVDNTLRNQLLYTNVLINDSDPNNDPLSVTLVTTTSTQGGALLVMPNKLVRYTPPTNFVGTDTYQYTLSDNHPGCSVSGPLTAIATVTITVKAVTTTLSGTVWGDVDISAKGGSDAGTPTFTNIKTNTETGTNAGGSLYVYLVDNTNTIVDKTPVDVDGTYQLSSVPTGTSGLTLILSNIDLAVGSTLTTGSLPTGYKYSTPYSNPLPTLPTTPIVATGGYDWGVYTSIIVSPGTIVAPAGICGGGGTPGTITSTANASGGSLTSTRYKYQWQSSTVADFSSSVTTNVADSLTTLTPSAPINVIIYYRRAVTTRAGGSVTDIDGPDYSNIVSVAVNPLPPVAISPTSISIASGLSTTLTASGASTYVWSPATGLSATTGASVVATPAATTAYIVTGTLTSTGCVNTSTITVTVVNPGTIGTNQSNCGTFTPTGLTSVSDASGPSPITYQWQSSTNGTTFNNIDAAVGAAYNPIGITTTTYYRRVASYAGTSFNSNIVTATVKAIPTVSAANLGPVCVGSTLNLTSTSSDAGSTYNWTGPNAYSVTNTQNPSITNVTAANAGTYTVTATATNGCTNTATTTVVVNALPTVTITPTAVTIANGLSTTLTAGGAGTYTWSPTTGLSPTTGATVVATPIVTTGYTVTGTSTVTGCVNTSTVTVTVLNPGTIGTSQTNCGSFTPTAFTSTTDASGASPITYQWQSSADGSTFTNITGATAVSYNPIGITNTTYYRRVATYSGTSVNSNTVTATVKPIPTVSAGNNGPLCAGTKLNLISTSSDAGSTYNWTGPNSYSVTNTQNPSISNVTTANGGTYTVTATATNGCTNTATTAVVVNALPTVAISPTSVILVTGLSTTLTASGATTYIWSPSTALSSTTTAAVIASPITTTTYNVTGTITSSGCTNTSSVIVSVVNSAPLTPGTVGSPQTICSGSVPVAFTSTAATGGTGTINYQWQSSTDNSTFTNITGATSATYAPPALTQTTYYRRVASTSSDAAVYTGSIKVNVLAKPVITGGISGPCAMQKDSIKTFSVTAAPNATNYVWTVPSGWTGTSTTNSINVKAGTTNGTISVVPYNLTCAGNTVTYNVAIIDYARVTITGTPVTASGNNNNPVTVTIQLIDVLGNLIGCSGGPATLCSNSGTFTKVVDNGDGTYTSYLISSANNVTICGSVGGTTISTTASVTFTGPQGGITSNGPIFSFETPTVTFTATAGRAPFTVVYHSAQKAAGANDTLTNVTSGVANPVALIPATTLYTLVSVIDANGERRDNNFTRDTTTTLVVTPRVIITLHASPAVKGADSTWAVQLYVKTKNIGNLDLTNSAAILDLSTVFPAPVTFVLDSVTYSGTTITPNKLYDGITQKDLFAKLNGRKRDAFASASFSDMNGSTDAERNMADNAAPDGSSISRQLWQNDAGQPEESGFTVSDDGHSVNMFGPLSFLPVGVEADMILYLHVKPHGYTDPFVMQAVALGTGHTQGATALATSLSNDNNDISQHPEITKKGDPLPAIVNLFPTASIGAALSAGTPVLQPDGSYNVLMSNVLHNYGNLNLQLVNLFQNLPRFIGSPATVSVVPGSVTATNNLVPNPNYNGTTDTALLLLVTGSELGYKQQSVIQYTINIQPNQLSAVYLIQATATGFSTDLSSTVTDLSTDGTNPDPDGNNIPSEKIPTQIVINQIIPPLVPGTIGIKTGPTTTALANGYCPTPTGIVIIPTTQNSGGLGAPYQYQYQWQSSTDNTTFTDTIGYTDSTFTTGTVTKSFYLRRGTISGSQVKYSNSVYIQIYPSAVAPVITGSSTLVVGTGNLTLSSSAASAYAWSTGATTRNILVTSAGSYTVSILDANGCPATSLAYTVTALDPYKVADLQKILSVPVTLQADGTFLLGFKLLAYNLRSELLDTVRIKDDLTKVFPSPTQFQVVSIKASGQLIANQLYNGNSQVDMLSDVSKLAGLKTDSVEVMIQVTPNGFSGPLYNQATETARSPYGSFSILSNDPTVGNGIGVRNPTKFVIPIIDIFIPSGFSPNHDGNNDVFVITHPFNTTISFDVFNRWGNLVFKSPDYKNEFDGRGNQPNRILGDELPDGTYYYLVLATDRITGTVRKFAGFLTLKR